MEIEFWKVCGNGNDFVVIIGDPGHLSQIDPAESARRLCDRRYSVGGDGLVFLWRESAGSGTLIRMRYYNCDGSRTFCGNGARCSVFVAFLQDWILPGEKITLDTDIGSVTGTCRKPGIASVELPDPGPAEHMFLRGHGLDTSCIFVDTGVPHAVIPVADVSEISIETAGAAVRNHPAFGNPGANADFISQHRNTVRARFYERGVEAETLSSGTGAVASAIAANILWNTDSPVTVKTEGGPMKVFFKQYPHAIPETVPPSTALDSTDSHKHDCITQPSDKKSYNYTDIHLEGEVALCFKGCAPL